MTLIDEKILEISDLIREACKGLVWSQQREDAVKSISDTMVALYPTVEVEVEPDPETRDRILIGIKPPKA